MSEALLPLPQLLMWPIKKHSGHSNELEIKLTWPPLLMKWHRFTLPLIRRLCSNTAQSTQLVLPRSVKNCRASNRFSWWGQPPVAPSSNALSFTMTKELSHFIFVRQTVHQNWSETLHRWLILNRNAVPVKVYPKTLKTSILRAVENYKRPTNQKTNNKMWLTRVPPSLLEAAVKTSPQLVSLHASLGEFEGVGHGHCLPNKADTQETARAGGNPCCFMNPT